MARKKREHVAGGVYHVCNRGLAQRSIFETRRDFRVFLCLLALSVWRREIRIIAFSLMTNHFHLLVQSVDGELGRAMQGIQSRYTQWFNRTRQRDGPLFRGRYASRRVEALADHAATTAYIDQNPVEAGMVPTADDYEFGSRFRRIRGQGLIWLTRDVDLTPTRAMSPEDRRSLFEVIEARLALKRGLISADELIQGDRFRTEAWLRERAILGDGTEAWLPICDSVSVRQIIREAEARGLPSLADSPWAMVAVECALLRTLCGASLQSISKQLKRSQSSVRRHLDLHTQHLVEDAVYRERVAELTHRAIQRSPMARGEARG